jgi:hypothetical protein
MTPLLSDDQYGKLANSLQAIQMGMEMTTTTLSDIKSHVAELSTTVAEQEKQINDFALWKAEMTGIIKGMKLSWAPIGALIVAIIGGGYYLFFKR